MEELYRRADKYSMLEDNVGVATQTVMITSQLAKGYKLSRKKPSESKEGQSRDRKRSYDQAQKKKKKKKKGAPAVHPLNISYERLLPIIRELPEFKWPTPI